MYEYLKSLREFDSKELEVVATLVEVCAKYDELYAAYVAAPNEKLFRQGQKLDEMRWTTAKSIGLCTLRGDFAQPSRHVFCLESDLLAQL
jgi:hypothetical protein